MIRSVRVGHDPPSQGQAWSTRSRSAITGSGRSFEEGGHDSRSAEVCPERDLFLDHGSKPPYPFADALRYREGVAEARELSTGTVRVEASTRHICHARRDGPRQHRPGINSVRQLEPDVESASRPGPA